MNRSLGQIWKSFRTIPGWVILLGVAILYSVFVLDWLPRGLRWPARMLMPLLGVYGYVKVFFDLRSGTSLLEGAKVVLKHPFTFMLIVTGLCLTIKEQFPFSHFPMYSNPSPNGDYYYLAQAGQSGESEPLPVSDLTGLTASKIGKIYRDKRDRYCREHRKTPAKLTPKDTQIIGALVLDDLYKMAREFTPGSDVRVGEWRLIRIEIHAYGGETPGFDETPTILATKKFSS